MTPIHYTQAGNEFMFSVGNEHHMRYSYDDMVQYFKDTFPFIRFTFIKS